MPKLNEAAPSRVLPQGTLYLWPHGILFAGTDMVNDTHRHFTASVHLALSGEFRVVTAGGKPVAYEGLLVAPNVEQQMDARGAEVVILQVDPETEDYSKIAHWFARKGPVCPLHRDMVGELVRRARRTMASPERFGPLELWTSLIDGLAEPGAEPRRLDPRIIEVLRILKQDSCTPPSASELAECVNLSEGRLIHLFTEQMGLPMRRYALWLRLRDAFLTLAEGLSLTEAAHRAGFADSAHMTRTFRGMFGVPPSFFQESRGGVRIEFVFAQSSQEWTHPNDRQRWEDFIRLRRHKA